jgi:hypothetical protein
MPQRKSLERVVGAWALIRQAAAHHLKRASGKLNVHGWRDQVKIG